MRTAIPRVSSVVLRTHLAAFFFFALFLRPSLASDPQWQFDLISATETASTNDQLLVVVQFDADCLSNARNSKELGIYQQSAIGSDTKAWLQKHATLAAENIGEPSNLTLLQPRMSRSEPPANLAELAAFHAEAQSPGNAITWLCRPDGVVLSCLVGYPEDHNLFETIAKQANGIRQLSNVTPNDLKTIRQWHLDQVQPTDRQLYGEWLKKVRRTGKPTRERKMSAAVRALGETRSQRIRQRFGSDLSEEQISSLTRRFSQHASIEQRLIHLLLADFPGIKLSELQSLLWANVADVTFWKPDATSMTNWLAQATTAGKPIILRIPDSREKLPSWPSSEKATELREQFMIRTASLADVAFAVKVLDTDPLTLFKSKTPTFFIADIQTKSSKLLTRTDSKTKLTKQIQQISNLSKQGK